MKSPNLLIATVVATCIALAGCATQRSTPEAPRVVLPDQFHTGITAPAATVPAVSAAWWKAFGDPVLDALVDRALSDSPDIAIASARIAAARAELAGTRA